mmetsp:Transcript_1271/g.2070  ORF Transcript_1271/g.2070 Transcript_1271/m.2070 type:complete len:308 (+) Transcript_1271:100-1023(+)|eukprot:CAMPEP_0185026076 /NCGR_PEP_ID=MMETSP1103-20130426/9803_1 /TAXON_ID=36769 /ORGANISM="Paraphysomonas bandaiensis, Strain Caron Lab Isolate" /LENGTH=307 /DNA_ID=CAMNT_0027559523 /DNA_START=24 /DNA_END=947 /DNA_ORIENTATION=+
MTTRNLTRRFVEIRNAAKANRTIRSYDGKEESSDSGLLGPDHSNWKSAKDTLPPLWVDSIEQAEADITRIQSKMRELGALHTKRLMVNFETDEVVQEREIDILTQDITDIFRHAEGLLKRFGSQGDEANISQQELTVRANMQRSMAKKLQGLSMSFRGSQKEYLSRLQAQKSGSGAQAFDFLSNEKKSGLAEVDTGFTTAQMQILEDTEDLVNQRDEEITRIAKSIEELAQIFKELAVLVIDQGTILDRIDYNMEQVLEHTKEGIVQLEKAENYQKSALPMRCIIVLVFLIAIMLGVLVLKNTSSKK